MTNAYAPSYSVFGLVGPDGAGKSVLASALAGAAGVSQRVVQLQGMSALVADIQAPRGVCQIVDFQHAEAEWALLGASRFTGAVLVVSATDSVLPGHRRSLERMRQLGVPLVAIAITKVDVVEDEELLDLAELEVRELATKFGHAGDAIGLVRTASPRPARPHEGEPVRGRHESVRRRPEGPGALLGLLVR